MFAVEIKFFTKLSKALCYFEDFVKEFFVSNPRCHQRKFNEQSYVNSGKKNFA